MTECPSDREQSKNMEVCFEEFGGSSINFIVRFGVDSKNTNVLEAKNNAIIALKQAFDEKELTIPHPIQTLNVDAKTVHALAATTK